jgi:hypothetical protein
MDTTTDKTLAVADFWLAVGKNNLAEAEAAVRRHDAPLVAVSSSYSFDLVEAEEEQQAKVLKDSGALGSTTPRGVIPGTPTSTIDAWNADVGVSLVVASKGDKCGARVSEGEVNFLACTGPNECQGGSGCGFTTHELGGKDSLKRPVVKMIFPEMGCDPRQAIGELGQEVEGFLPSYPIEAESPLSCND